MRGLEIQGKFVKFTAIGVYLENDSLQYLADRWKCKTAGDLTESDEFYRDIVTGNDPGISIHCLCNLEFIAFVISIQTLIGFINCRSVREIHESDDASAIDWSSVL